VFSTARKGKPFASGPVQVRGSHNHFRMPIAADNNKPELVEVYAKQIAALAKRLEAHDSSNNAQE
jgi:hypothetical protein